MLKVILVGYPGSQFIVPASRYLTGKYLQGFDIQYLNWTGLKEGWSGYLSSYLNELNDEFIIFALDDYLLSSPLDKQRFDEALNLIAPDVACVKLCPNTPEEHKEYPVTTQYTIWRRSDLIELLNQTSSPWDFEMRGSSLLNKKSILYPCLDYPTHSCLSNRWQGVRLDGVNPEDLEIIKKLI